MDEERIDVMDGGIVISTIPSRSAIATEIKVALGILNDKISRAEKLGLEVSIKEMPECELLIAKYRVEITQTITF